MEDEPDEGNLRRRAYRAALIRLAKAWPQPYKEFWRGVKLRDPSFSSGKTTSTARRLLREAFAHRFDQVYEEEKVRLGLLPSVSHCRDWDAAAEEVVRLYQNGNGLTVKEIRDKLQVGSDFVSESLKNAGITPKKGRRKKNG
jgi:hypothetical protein